MSARKRLLQTVLAALLCACVILTPALTGAVQAEETDDTGAAPVTEEGNNMDDSLSADPGVWHASVSQGVRNIVRRAYQLTDIVWTPARDVEGWKDRDANRFLAGQSYTGIPYGQPHRSGSYVPWQTGLTEFLQYVNDPNSAMYTGRAVSQVLQNPSPFYSCECSAFVSWAWGLPQRETTQTLGQYATCIGNQLSDLQVGDCMLREGKHVRLVTDILYDAENKLVAVEICEEREPVARRIWYSAGSAELPLSLLQTDYLDKGYVIYRYRDRDAVGYTHACAVPQEGDVCPHCGKNPFRDLELNKWYAPAIAFVNNQGLMTGTGADTFSPKKNVTRGMMVTMLWRMYHSPDSSGTLPFRDIRESAYYYKALRWAWTRGYAAGTGNSLFSPKKVCTRAEIVTFLWTAAGRPAPKLDTCAFRDVKRSAYYYKALLWAVGEGIVSGKTADTFGPKDAASRAETAAMIWRACVCQKLFPSP